jgi:hypothetical protein
MYCCLNIVRILRLEIVPVETFDAPISTICAELLKKHAIAVRGAAHVALPLPAG